MDIITRLEEAILIAVWKLAENAYGVTINKHVSESFHKKYTMGALYFSLDQLLRKGFVNKYLKNISSEKAGRSRTYYTLTSKGKKALQEVQAHQKSLWEGIPEIAFERKNSK